MTIKSVKAIITKKKSIYYSLGIIKKIFFSQIIGVYLEVD